MHGAHKALIRTTARVVVHHGNLADDHVADAQGIKKLGGYLEGTPIHLSDHGVQDLLELGWMEGRVVV